MRTPRKLPKLAYGEGSFTWDAARERYDLRHRVGGKLQHERGQSPEECIAKRDARRARFAERGALVDDGVVTVARLLAAWRDFAIGAKAPATIDGYDASIVHIVAHVGDRLAVEIRAIHLEAMCKELIARGFSRATIVKVRSVLTMAFAYGLRHGYIATNPMNLFEMPGGAQPARQVQWLDGDEMARMRAHLKARPSSTNTALLVMLLTGMRPGEVLGLRWEHVDFDAGTVAVEGELQRSMGGRVLKPVDDVKTLWSRRLLQLPADAVAALRHERTAQLERRLAAKTWANETLAFTTDTGRPIRFENLDRSCKRACALANVKIISPNGLRHTNASWLLHCGLPAEQVAKHLGHKNIRMVTTTYGHSMVEVIPTAALFDAVER